MPRAPAAVRRNCRGRPGARPVAFLHRLPGERDGANPTFAHNWSQRFNDRGLPAGNNVRDAAGVDRLKIDKIQPGERVQIIAGPACVGSWTWWKIQFEASGLTGWTAEGNAENYWLAPEA